MSDRGVSRQRRCVLMLGTSLDGKGGIVSVVKTYQAGGLFSRWPVTYLPTHSAGNAVRKLSGALSAWSSYVIWLLRRKFVLHVHSASRASFWRKSTFILPAAWTGRPVIFHLHGAEFMQFYEEDCGPLAKRIVTYVLDRCARIVVLSESWCAAVARITTNNSIHVIANPALPSQFGSELIERVPGMLVFFGRLGSRKGIYVLLDALKSVVERHPGARLICGGDGELDEVRRAANERGLGNNVEILGWVDEMRRTELLGQASIFVLPSFAEGLPMSILEAMSAKLPIISTPVGGIPDAITHGREGFLVPAGDARALSEAICKLLNDSDLRALMGGHARLKFDACFNVNVVIPKIEAMYRQLGVQPREPA